jgi:hypothetical protein
VLRDDEYLRVVAPYEETFLERVESGSVFTCRVGRLDSLIIEGWEAPC